MIPVTEVQLPANLEPEAAALLYWAELQWLMAQVPEPQDNAKGS